MAPREITAARRQLRAWAEQLDQMNIDNRRYGWSTKNQTALGQMAIEMRLLETVLAGLEAGFY